MVKKMKKLLLALLSLGAFLNAGDTPLERSMQVLLADEELSNILDDSNRTEVKDYTFNLAQAIRDLDLKSPSLEGYQSLLDSLKANDVKNEKNLGILYELRAVLCKHIKCIKGSGDSRATIRSLNAKIQGIDYVIKLLTPSFNYERFSPDFCRSKSASPKPDLSASVSPVVSPRSPRSPFQRPKSRAESISLLEQALESRIRRASVDSSSSTK